MGWICTKCSLQLENRSIFNKHLSSIENVESGYTKEEPTSKISQLPTLTISPVPKKTENLYLQPIHTFAIKPAYIIEYQI